MNTKPSLVFNVTERIISWFAMGDLEKRLKIAAFIVWLIVIFSSVALYCFRNTELTVKNEKKTIIQLVSKTLKI